VPLEQPDATGHLTYIPTSWYVYEGARHPESQASIEHRAEQGDANMNTLLITTQIVCYGVGIVSASLNIATFVRRRGQWHRLRSRRPRTYGLVGMIVAKKGD
jgi:hypothetical protein